LRFNERLYDKARAIEVFDHTSQVARSFLEPLRRLDSKPVQSGDNGVAEGQLGDDHQSNRRWRKR
jgi:hypothetical protein